MVFFFTDGGFIFLNICLRIKLFKNGLILKKKWGIVYFTFLK